MLILSRKLILALSFSMGAAPALAEQEACLQAYFQKQIRDSLTGWTLESPENIGQSEGGSILRYRPEATARGFDAKLSVLSCASFYCDHLVATTGEESYATLSIEWGGTATLSAEKSLIFEDGSGASCLVYHAGGETFRAAAEARVGTLMQRARVFGN